jgi:dipeptidyl-peptidase-4
VSTRGWSASHDVFVAEETSLSGVHRLVVRSLDGRVSREIPSVAAESPVPRVEMETVGPDHVHVALVRPRSYVPGARYPLIDAAYGGPHAQVVSLDPRSMLMPQWMADATGAVVVTIDAKGTPGRGRAWERAIAGKLGDVPIDGHIEVIHALLALHPEIDGSRIGVYGKSFGATFAALAVLRHPDVYKAGVAIAPVTDWRNYDTAYTERYLGLPDANAAAYDASSVLVAARAPASAGSEPSLLVAHGTADDNVYFFNSLQLVEELAKAGRPFRFLPFMGQTHQIASPDANVAIYSAAAEAFVSAFQTASPKVR